MGDVNENSEIPVGWAKVKLPEFCYLEMGQSPSSDTYNSNGIGLPFYQGKTEFGVLYPTPEKYCSAPNKIAITGDTLLSVRAPVGPTNLCAHRSCIGRGLAAIRPQDAVHPKFVLFLFRGLEKTIADQGTGTTFSAITKDFLVNLEIKVPPLNEQHRIVAKIEELFSEIDKGVESLKTAKAQLQVYRQALLKHAFEGKLTAQWRADNPDRVVPAAELLRSIEQAREERYQQQLTDWQTAVEKWEFNGKKGKKPNKPKKIDEFSPIEKSELENLLIIPSEWVYVRLAEIAMIGSGVSVSQERQLEDPIEVSYLRVANVQRGKLVLDEIKTMKIERFKLHELALKQWDILFNEGGDRDKLGRGWVWESQVNPCITQNHVFRATTYIGFEHHAKYISHWGNSFGQKYFDTEGKQTTNLASINKTVLNNFPIPLTSLEEQAQIISILESSFSVIDRFESDLEKGLAQAEMLRQSILKKAFSGQLVPQDPNDEPASELLKRIQAEKVDRETTTKKPKVRSSK